MVKMNLHLISYQLSRYNKSLLRFRCDLLPFCDCFRICLNYRINMGYSTQSSRKV